MNSYSDKHISEFSDIEENFGNQYKDPCMSDLRSNNNINYNIFLSKNINKKANSKTSNVNLFLILYKEKISNYFNVTKVLFY